MNLALLNILFKIYYKLPALKFYGTLLPSSAASKIFGPRNFFDTKNLVPQNLLTTRKYLGPQKVV